MNWQNFKKSISKHWDVWILGVVVAVSLFLHFWNFSDWLLFKADQSRDAYYAKEVSDEGWGHLRTLGPKMNMVYIEGDLNNRGDTVHLGPFYYYLQYFSSIFLPGGQPWNFAFMDALMFIFSIPLLYYLLTHFLSKPASLLTASVYGFSYFNLIYSRFGWNCNQLFFWEILLILSLVKASDSKDGNHARWLLLLLISFLVISQLHFVALAIFLLLGILYVIFFGVGKLGLKHLLVGIGIVLIFYGPVLASEIKNNWDNTKRMLIATQQENSSEKSTRKKLTTIASKTSQFVTFAATSLNDREVGGIELYGGLFFVFSLAALFFLLVSSIKKSGRHNNYSRAYFLFFAWGIISLLIFFKISSKLDNMRYYITISPLVFMLLGMWFSLLLGESGKKSRLIIPVLVAFLLLVANFSAQIIFFKALTSGNEPSSGIRNPRFEVYDDLITYGNMEKGYDYMLDVVMKENKEKICYRNANYQYNLGFEYIHDMGRTDIPIDRFGEDENSLDCGYFYIGKKKRGKKDIDEDFFKRFKIVEKQDIGGMTVWRMDLKEEIKQEILAKKEAKGQKKENKTDENEDDDPRAFTWAEVLGD